MKKDYKKYVDNEMKLNKELLRMTITVRYKDGLVINYTKWSE